MWAQQDDQEPRIVVGVDGSAPSRAALRWAVREAGLIGATVDALIAWQYPGGFASYGWATSAAVDDLDYAELAEKTLAEALSSAVDPASDVSVQPCSHRWYTAMPLRRCLRPLAARSCWLWAAAGMAASLARCSARSASTACITRRARWSCCAASTKPDEDEVWRRRARATLYCRVLSRPPKYRLVTTSWSAKPCPWRAKQHRCQRSQRKANGHGDRGPGEVRRPASAARHGRAVWLRLASGRLSTGRAT